MTITEAIARSSSHDEIVHLAADSLEAAQEMIAEATIEASLAELESDWNETNDGLEIWAGPAASEKMEWRLAIKVIKE